MAEIKSTMDMVMERAARMAAEAGETDYLGEERLKEGMRLGAAFMHFNKNVACAEADAAHLVG